MSRSADGFVCTDAEIEEVPAPEPADLRREVMFGIYSVALGGMDFQIRKYFSFNSWNDADESNGLIGRGDMRMIWDALAEIGPGQIYERGLDGVEVTVMDKDKLDQLAQRWCDTIVALCLAHDKRAVDDAEFGMDDLLTPLISVPGRQLKEFWGLLRAKLENDRRAPFFVWKFFRIWEEAIIARAEDIGPVELKKELAGRIATLVEADVKPDIMEAISGALQWRSQETLEKVETAIKSGGRARVRGRESCLFLEIVRPAPLPEGCDETCTHEHEGVMEVVERVML